MRSNARAKPLITLVDVTLGFGRSAVLTDLNLEIRADAYLGIVGPNGSGKTTLLRGILGTLKPLAGEVVYSRRPVRFGYVPQLQSTNDLFPLTVLDVAVMGRYNLAGHVRRRRQEHRRATMESLEQVGIADIADRLFRDLSGGQKQRTLMARALASEPDILVLDEPTNDMDIAAEHATMEMVDRLHHERGIAVLMVSHLLNVVVNHVSDVALVGVTPGRVEFGPVNEIVRPGYLSSLYGMDLQVIEVGDRRVVL